MSICGNIFYNKNMIKNNLSRILGEQRLKMSDLCRISGLSRSAVERLYHDKTGGIDFDTLDKLCKALECTPNDLFEYIER